MARYYWLKMRRDFFKRHDIRILEGLTEGKELVLFYLKLLVESVDHDGALRYSATRPYTPEMLGTITDTTTEFAAQALEVLADLELIKDETDGTILLPHALDLIGSAADNDNAKRQARYRDAHKDSNATVTDSNAKSNAVVTQSNADSNADSNATVTDSNKNNNESKSKSKSKSKSIDSVGAKAPAKTFVAPTHDQVLDFMTNYCFEKGLSVDPVIEAEKFVNYYTGNGWRVGRNKMKDYKATARNWLLNAKEYKKADPATNPFTDILGGDF